MKAENYNWKENTEVEQKKCNWQENTEVEQNTICCRKIWGVDGKYCK